MGKQKDIVLRAYTISVEQLSQAPNALEEMLRHKIDGSTASSRMMQLNEMDNESDLLASYKIGNGYVFGVMLRVTKDSLMGQISPEMFDQETIKIDDVVSVSDKGVISYKHHYYFLLKGDKIVVSVPKDTTIKRLQTYLNWYLEQERGDMFFTLTAMVSNDIPIETLRDITEIRLGGNISVNSPSDNNSFVGIRRFQDIGVEIIRLLVGDDVDTMEAIENNNLVSAQLSLSFKRKPKEMTKEDYDRTLGSTITPIADLSGIQYKTRKGTFVSGNDMQCQRKVCIDKTSTGNIVEEGLKQEMLRFISDL